MKVSYVAVAGVLLGAALGAGTTWSRFGNPPLSPLPSTSTGAITAQVAQGEGPKVSVDQRVHDFGPIERGTEVRHAFHFQNIGQGTLALKPGGTTCSKCTIAEVDKPELAPGESAKVTVAYLAGEQIVFRQLAWVTTNDPDERRVELTVTGQVSTRFEVIPSPLVLSRVSANETRRADIKIFAFFSDSVEVASHEFIEAETAPYFEAKFQPIPAAQVVDHKAKSGCLVELTLKPGLPLGPFRQTIRLHLRMGDAEETSTADVLISGTIDSDISIAGAGWNSDAGRLTIGNVKSAEGATRQVLVLVRGANRHDVTIKPSKVDPEWLKVVVGEPSDLSSGAVTQIPLTIEIPPNAPQVNHLGSEQGKFAEIVLDTTHPDVKQIRMFLKFVTVP
jgi:hypothetical protein